MAAPDPSALAQSFFDTRTFSDIEICCYGQRIKAHKVVLSQGSPYFKRALTGDVKQEHAGQLKLNDDSPLVVRGIIAWMYGLEYDGVNQYAENQGSVPFFVTHIPPRAGLYAKYLIELFVAANKYELGSLATRIKAHLPTVLEAVAGREGHVLPQIQIHHLTDVVYGKHGTLATELRPLFVKVFTEHMGRFSDELRFNRMLRDIPELAVEIVQALAAAAKGGESGIAGCNKRKAETQDGPPRGLPQPRLAATQASPASNMMLAQPIPRRSGRSVTPPFNQGDGSRRQN